MYKGSKITVILGVSSIAFFLAVLLLAWKGGYIGLVNNAMGLVDNYSYSSNASYLKQIDLLNEYKPAQTNVVFLGDSITEGCDFNELFGITFSVNRGISGDTTEGVLNRLDAIIDLQPRQIFIMIGINDIGLNMPQNAITSNYRSILGTFQDRLQDTEVYILSVLPVSIGHRNPGRIPGNIVALNSIISGLAQEYGYKYVDLYTSMSDKDGNLRAELTTDGVHLSEEGYHVVKDVLSEYVLLFYQGKQ